MALSKIGPSGALDNKLMSLSCKTRGDDIRPVCLMGLVSMEKTEEETEGWILLISGDPLIPHMPGAPFRNKITIDRLRLTDDQKLAIVENSLVRDGYVYLYGGNFSVGKCQRSKECQQHNLNILKVLSSHLSKHVLDLDLTQVVPLKEKLLSKIVMPRNLKKKKSSGASLMRSQKVGGLGQEKVEMGGNEKKEKLRFRCTDHQVFVELECPANHTGYHVGILLLETFVCKPNVLDTCDRSRITRIVEQADLVVPPNFDCHICAANQEPLPERITLTVKGFRLPVYENRCERRILDNFMVKWVEYRGMAHFIKHGEWKGVTMQKLMSEQVDGRNERKKEVAVRLSTSSSKNNVAYPSPSMGSTSSGAYPHCEIPVKLVVMEVELKGEEEEEEKAEENVEGAEERGSDPEEDGEREGEPEEEGDAGGEQSSTC